MKLFIRYIVFISVLFNIVGIANGQDLPYALKDATFSQIDNHIRAFWTTNKGYSCNSVSIELSKDTVNFESIYTYPGICGLGQNEKSYQHIFTSPFQSAYYRLNLGIYGATKPVHIILRHNKKSGILVYPNPVNHVLNIALGINHPQNFNLKIINAVGKVVFSNTSIRQLTYSVDVQLWENGVYFIYTEDKHGQQLEFQKVIIAH